MESLTTSILHSPSTPSLANRTTSQKAPALSDGTLNLTTSNTRSESLTFVRKNDGYTLQKEYKLRNSLLMGVGFLELANAGDFAANVWNQVPAPKYALVLMALGGTLALGFVYFAVKDARLSWQNIKGLREEYRYLKEQKELHNKNVEMVHTLNTLLAINFRETGTEVIDRIGMDSVMGFGAFLVGVGTYMAIDGINHKVWLASNLLSGYIGNTPCALYGLANMIWSAYIWIRAHRHSIAVTKELEAGRVERMFSNRIATVQLHAALNGIAGAVAGAASLVTATMWWGYVVLAPCIISSIIANYLWRCRVGYTHIFVRQIPMDRMPLVEELEHIASVQQAFGKGPRAALPQLVSNPESFSCLLEFITRNELFENFCTYVLKDAELVVAIGSSNDTVTIDSNGLLGVDERLTSRLLEMAKVCIKEMGPTCISYRERYHLEALGCYMSVSVVKPTSEEASEKTEEAV